MGVPQKMIVSGNELEAIIPQKYPMIMVDGLLFSDGTITKTCLRIRKDNIFYSSGLFREPGLMENIAQTAASGVGYQDLQNNQDPLPGYIASIQKLNIHQLPLLDSEIITTVELKNRVFDIMALEGKIHLGKTVIASCEMKVLQNIKTS
jgi:hypothetical protein